MEKEGIIYYGTSGLVVPVSKAFYPPAFEDKSRLQYYASLFNSIEINSSFYKLPMAATVKKWAESVPEDFRFTFKISKTITHVKNLEYSKEDIIKFMETVSYAENKKGCLLIQFPPGLQRDFVKLNEFFSDIREVDRNSEWKIAIEYRHNSWYHEKIYRLMEQHQAALVMHDLPASSPPADEYESEILYLRFHGPGGKYRGSYEDDFLHEYSYYIREWQEQGKTVYVYFNNTMGDALKNLNTLRDFIWELRMKSACS